MKKYNIIYADPAWSYDKKIGQGIADDIYTTMSTEAIMNLPVQSISADDCFLFLWVTFPMLQEGLDVMKAWGFEYKTLGFSWIKTNKRQNQSQLSFLPVDSIDTFFGIGHYTKSNCEVCLIGKIGMPNKIDKIPYPKSDKKLPIVLSIQEIQSMFNVCENTKHKVILSLLYSCGFRVSELINLKWSHIDRSRMVINVIQAKGKKDRQVSLSSDLIPLLEKYWKEYKPKEYVLNGQSSLQYSDRSVNEVIKQLAEKAGIKKRVYAHLIRHCYATHLVEAGTDLNIIQRLLGHSSVKTTAIYTHVSHTLISKTFNPLSNISIIK